MSLNCLSCKEPVGSNDVKFFAEVFLCRRCYSIAERLFQRGEAELRMMLIVLKESIRLAALKGELQFALHHVDDMKKEDLMAHLARLASEVHRESFKARTEEEDKCPPRTSTPSPASTPPSAASASGSSSSG